MAVAGAGFAAGVFFVAVPVTPFLIVPITVLFAVVAGGAAAAFVVLFLTTVPVLPSLDSLMALTLRAVRDVAPALEAGAVAAAAFLVLVAAEDPLAEVAVEDVVVFLVVAAARVERAFSTMLLNMPLFEGAGLAGDTGRAMNDLPGEAAAAARSRGGRTRLLEEVGDRICAGLGKGLVAALAGLARPVFFLMSMCAISFSLSPPDMSSLDPFAGRTGDATDTFP